LTEGSEPGAVHGAESAAPVASGGPHSGAVFISYASQDAAAAQALCAALEREGVACWIAPRDVRAGESYAAAIVQAINTCRMLLLVLSRSAIESPHVLREVERASSKRRPVLSVRLDGAELTPELEYFLSAHQWLDASGGPIEQIVPALIDSARARATGTPSADLHHSGAAARATQASHAASYPSDSGHGLPFKLSALEQLKRRHVGRVAVLYVAVCYLILEPFSTFLHVLALPEWTGRVLMGLMVLGFPAALIFAWVFEPAHATKSAPDAEAHRRTARLTGRRFDIAIIIVLAVALAYFAADKFWLSKHEKPEQVAAAEVSDSASIRSAPVVSDKSIAVLPFTDLSEKHDQEYFADGIAEEIIDRLVKVPELRVPARASSFYFKGRPTKVSEIARDLSVANVLEGSVRKSATRLRVTVQLVRADTGYQVWSESYDRELQDVFKVQDEIATAVAGALQISLMGGPLTQDIGGTHSLKAYQLYLRARHDLFEFTAESLKNGEDLLQQAVKIDPNFGLAWSLMALMSVNESDLEIVSTQNGYGRGRRLAMHAIEVSPGLAQPHAILAYSYTTYDWDWPAAAAEVHKALDINPRDEWALDSAGVLAQTLGHRDEAVRYFSALVVQDPLSTIGYSDLGNTLYLAGRYSESEAAYRRGLEINPNFSLIKKFFAKTLLAEGKTAAALDTLDSMEPGPFKLQYLPAVLLANGRKADADLALQELISKYPDSFTYSIAMNLAYRKEKDLSMQWLERAYALKDDALIELAGEPLFRNLADDPRFKAFLRKMNLPE
jgi:adenylate cyclase